MIVIFYYLFRYDKSNCLFEATLQIIEDVVPKCFGITKIICNVYSILSLSLSDMIKSFKDLKKIIEIIE